MKIAVAGKGGSGKTTISGTLARALARAGNRVIAIDADLNPNLGLTLGLGASAIDHGTVLDHDILEHREVGGKTTAVLAKPLESVLDQYAVPAPDGINMLLMGRPETAGGG